MLFSKNKFILSYLKWIILLIGLACLTSIFTVVSPIILKDIIDNNFINNNLNEFIPNISLLILIYLFSAIAIFLNNYFQKYVEVMVFQDKTLELLPLILSAYDFNKNGDLINRLMDNLKNITNLITNIIPQIILNIINIIFPLFVMVYYNWKLTLIIISPISIVLFSSYIFGIKIEKTQQELVKINSKLYNILNEIFSLKLFIKTSHLENFFLLKYEHTLKNYQKKVIKTNKIFSVNIFIEFIIMGLPTLLLIVIGGKLIIDNKLSVGTFAAFNSYIYLFFTPLSEISENWMNYKSCLPSFERITELYQSKKIIYGNKNVNIKNGHVKFENVSFQYDDRKIFENLSICFNNGLNYIIGDNGTGKTTILKLITMIVKPTTGKIFIDRYAIEEISEQTLQNSIGIVFDKSFIFEDTLLENIRLGNKNVPERDIYDVINIVKLNSLINKLPNGINTILNEKINLSSGEKQKIALSRVILRDYKILLLDEVTKSIDSKSKHEIMDCLKELGKKKTIILIDHELNDKYINKNEIIINLNLMSNNRDQ